MSFTQKSKKKWAEELWLRIAAPVLVMLIGSGLVYFFGLQSVTSETFTFTVFVHGKEGKNDIILKNEGVVRINLEDGTPREDSINNIGEATFKGIPDYMEGDSVTIIIDHPQPYKPVDLNKKYELRKNGKQDLEVKLYKTDSVYGTVIDSKSNFGIEMVRVSIRDIETRTDKYGYYNLVIPEEYQRKFQQVRFVKEGYHPVLKNNIPVHTDQSLDILLTKIR